MIAELQGGEDLSSNLRFNVETVKTGKKGRPEQIFHLNEELTLCLTTGYSSRQRMIVIERMKALEKMLDGPYQQLQNLSVDMKVSQRLGQIGSEMMNKRKDEKRKLQKKETSLLMSVQLSIDFDLPQHQLH